jgi:hypothetical protein
MRAAIFGLIAAALLSGCGQGNRDLITGGTWTCSGKYPDEGRMDITFEKGGRLVGKAISINPAVGSDISLEFEGTWRIEDSQDLIWNSSGVKTVEGKLFGRPLDPAERETLKRGLEGTGGVKARIQSISSSRMVLAPQDDDEIVCTR